MSRIDELGDAGIRVVARGGGRSLTHRAVDAEAGVPSGSTTYYARTRHALTALVVARITEHLELDLDDLVLPDRLDDAMVVGIAEGFLERLAARREAQAARLAFLTELRDDPDLRVPLTAEAPVRTALVATAETLLRAVGVADAPEAAVDFVGLLDALLLYRTADVGPLDASRVLGAYVAGLRRT
jgi:AcrR family transcriptional regulator